MANAQKYTKSRLRSFGSALRKTEGRKGEYVKFGNQDIDPQKTHLNYNLAPRRGVEQIDFIRQRTTSPYPQEGRCECHVFMVVTLPEYRHHNQNLHVSPDKEQVERLFFERTIASSATATGSRMSYRRMSIRTKKRRICTSLSCRLQRTRSEGAKGFS